jgi:hypothetical protein
MAAPALTKEETAMLTGALELAITSTQRQQNTKGKLPAIIEEYKKLERAQRALLAKINS